MANLHLAIISKNTPVVTHTHIFDERGGSIGRAPDCDWTLDDGERFISNRHLLVSFINGKFVLTDTSSNGTFVNQSSSPVGKGNIFEPQVNDTITLGTIELMVTALDAGGQHSDRQPASPSAAHIAQSDDLLDLVSPALSTPAKSSSDISEQALPLSSASAGNANLGLFDILTQAETAAPMTPQQAPQPSSTQSANPASPGANTIPDNWDTDDLSLPAVPATPPPVIQKSEAPVIAPMPAPEQAAEKRQQPVTSEASQIKQTHQSDDFFIALYSKLGLSENALDSVDKAAFIDDIATIINSSTLGIMGLLAGRSAFKQESRLAMTMIQPRSNNPIKFSLDPSDALEMLLVKKRAGYLSTKDAYEEALNDVQQHQMAFMSALQASLTGLLKELSPDELEQENSSKGRLFTHKNNSNQKWQAFSDKHAQLVSKINENFNDVLATHFSAAYDAYIKNSKQQ